ncbi:hypothetical protein ACVIIW_003682 [Bradyrhizobium sp. USDA 4449]
MSREGDTLVGIEAANRFKALEICASRSSVNVIMPDGADTLIVHVSSPELSSGGISGLNAALTARASAVSSSPSMQRANPEQRHPIG